MQKTNILFVITKLELGGAQIQALTVLAGLDREKYNPFLFTAAEGLLMEEALSRQGLQVYRCRFLERPVNFIKDAIVFLKLIRFIRVHTVHVVHTHSSKAGIIGRIAASLAGVRSIIHTVHGWPFNDYQFPLVRWLYIRLERMAASVCHTLIVVSEHDRRIGLANKIGRPEQYCLIPYGIDHSVFQRVKPVRAHDKEAAGPVVGMVACFKPQKSAEDFIAAAGQLSREFPHVRFVIAGDGKLRPRLESMRQQCGLVGRMDLIGWTRDIPRFLASLDIFVLTSLWEGMPISVLEAMSAALPVVVTDTGGVREIVSDGENGFIVERRDVAGIAAKVRLLCCDASLREKMGRCGREKVLGSFSRAAMAARHEQLYAASEQRSAYG